MATETPPPGATARSTLFIVALALVAATVIAYLPVRHAGFLPVWDDDYYVTENPFVRTGLTGPNALRAFVSFHAGNWHPLTWLSHMADVSLFGLDPGMHHQVNVGIHAANAVLLFLLLTRLTGFPGRSAFVAALFALHPLHVESVAWISERKDLLAAFFFLLALDRYARNASRPSVSGYLAALACFALGLLSKPTVVTLPFVLLLIDYWPLARTGAGVESGPAFPPARRILREKWPFLLLSAAASLVTLLAQKAGGMITPLSKIPLSERLPNAVLSYAFYLRKTFLPVDLAAYYPHPGTGYSRASLAVSALALTGVSILAVRQGRTRPWLAVGWFWFVGTLVPMIGLVQVSDLGAADRYTYIPLIGIFLLVAWGGAELAGRFPSPGRVTAACAVAVLLLLAAATHRQSGYWNNPETLFRHAIASTDNNHVAMANLANVLYDRGPGGAAEAMALNLEALRIRPGYDVACVNMGYALHRMGRPQEAIGYYLEGIRHRTDLYQAHAGIGMIFMEHGDYRDAVQWFGNALGANPGDPGALENLGSALEAAGNSEEAIARYEQSLRRRPNERIREKVARLRAGLGSGKR